jgi:tRNA(Ile)-lysidine synthase
MFKKLTEYLKTHTRKSEKTPTIILGLSGGPDSVFLFYFLKQLQKEEPDERVNKEDSIKLIAAHLNHGWRENAHKDETFCKKLCEKYNIPLIIEHAKNLSVQPKFNGSKEEIGRKLRRHFFKTLCKKHNATYIALAHHQQDQQETFFMRLLRGTTLNGLTAMKPVDGIFLRPLLTTSKKEILEYLKQNNLDYIIDHTNESDSFLRNRIRKYVIPALQKCDDRFNKKLESTLEHLKQEDDFLDRLTEKVCDNVFAVRRNQKDTTTIGNKTEFANLDLAIQKRLIPYWLTKEKVIFSPSNTHIMEIIRFLKSPRGGTHSIHQTWCIKKQQNNFWIEKL